MIRKLSHMAHGFLNAVPHPKPQLPRVIQFPVNDICNSRCQMCNIWQQKLTDQLSPEQTREILSNRLFKKVTSIGINGGEPTLRKDLPALMEAIADGLPALQRVSLITNAIVHKKVNRQIDDLGAICADRGIHLDVMVSLDGIGEVHDRVRGIPGNFEAAVQVLDHVADHPNVQTHRIGCTVIRENVYDVENVLSWCEARNIYARFRVGIPHQRLYGADLEDPFAFTPEERFHFANFLDHLHAHYEQNESRRFFYRSLRNQLVYQAPRAAGCAWKHQGVTLSYDGKLAYCAVESDELGDALNEDANTLFWANTDHLKEINESKCATCMHDYEGISDRKVWMKQAAQGVLKRGPEGLRTWAATTRQKSRQRQEERRLEAVLEQPANGVLKRPKMARPRVLICGWYGTETLGDKAILGGIIHAIRRAQPEAVVDVAALEPYVTQNTARQMPELQIEVVLDLAMARTNIQAQRYAAVVMGGGPLMAGVSECIDMLELFALARSAGSATIIAGCGVGPLGASHRNETIAAMLKTADFVLLRDKGSIQLARTSLGFEGDAQAILDPAFVWIASRRAARPSAQPTREQVLLAVRDWPVREYGGSLEQQKAQAIKNQFEVELLHFIESMQGHMGESALMPFCMHKQAVGGDDRVFYRRLLADHPGVLKQLDSRHRPPEEDLRQFEQSTHVLAMRFHSVVFALATGRPFLAIDYTLGGKITGLLTDLGRQDALISLADFNGAEAAERLRCGPHEEADLQGHIDETERALVQTFREVLA